MDCYVGIGLEAEFNAPASNLQDNDFEQAIEAGSTSDHNRFMAFPR
jgi:hypothetical protein